MSALLSQAPLAAMTGFSAEAARISFSSWTWLANAFLRRKPLATATAWCSFSSLKFRRPTMEPFSCQEIAAISTLLPLEFRFSEGHFVQFDLILTCFDLFRRADLTYFHLFRPIRWADLTYFHLLRPISFHNKAPWTGHLMKFAGG